MNIFALELWDNEAKKCTAQTNQQSRDLNLKWKEACQFARRIEEALRNKEIIVHTRARAILSVNGDEEIYL